MPKFIKQLKILLSIAIIITFISVILNFYTSMKMIDSYKKNQISMAKFILTTIKSSNRLLFMSQQFSKKKFQDFVNELTSQKSIQNIIIYNESKNIILNFITDNKLPLYTNFNNEKIIENNNQIIIYSKFKPKFGNSMHKNRNSNAKNMMKYFNDNSTYFIAIKINLKDFNDLKKITYFELLKNIFIQILLILIFLYTLKLIKIFEQSKRELKIAEEQAKLASYSKTLAHEIKNPLSSISGLVDFVKNKLTDEKLKEYLINAQEEIDRLNKIVNDFLNFGKEMQINKTNFRLDEIIEKSIGFMKYEAEVKNINFELDIQEVEINADKDKIMQVILNLILNAIQAAPKNSNIEVSLKNNSLIISNQVANSEKLNEKELFTPFYSTKTVGTGLGLSICKKIIELHNYKISVNSTNPFIIEINFEGKK